MSIVRRSRTWVGIVLVLGCAVSLGAAEPEAPGDKGEWKLTWHDEFDGAALDDTNWSPLQAAYSNKEEAFYAPEHATVVDGALILRAEQKANPDGKPYTSGAVTSKGKFAQTYGRFEARMKLPVGQGYWPAFWLLPEDTVVHGPWPACGEIDILETGGDTNAYAGTLHFAGRNNQHTAAGIGSVKLPADGINADYHVYAVEWEPREIRWYCDDTLTGKVARWSTYGPHGQEQQPLPAPFDKDFYIILNLAVGGDFVGGKLPLPGNTSARIMVDYVRVYAKDRYEAPEPISVAAPRQKLRPSGVNLLAQGDFEGEDQRLWQTDGRFEIAEPRVVDGELVVELGADVKEQHMQSIRYSKYLDIENDTTYRLSFRARSSVDCRHVRPVIDRPKANWSKLLLYSALAFTTEMQDYAIEFTTTAADRDARLLFYMGLMDGDQGGGRHTLYFDDIRLEKMILAE